jgi:hypothetical protein
MRIGVDLSRQLLAVRLQAVRNIRRLGVTLLMLIR